MKRPFTEWLRLVDRAIEEATHGLLDSHDDLPDCNLADWYEDGVSPARAAKRVIKNAKTY